MAPANPKTATAEPRRKQVGSRVDAELRMRLFAHEFHTNGGNAKNAALAAGYSPKGAQTQGSLLLSNPKVIAHLQNLSAQSASAAIAEAVEVHGELTKILRGQTTTPYVTKQGLVMGPPSAADRIKAGSELQKMRGGYAPVRVEVQVTNQVQMWLVQTLQIIGQQFKLTAQQLDDLAAQLPPLALEQGR